jgi:hypothetical protein
MPASGVVRGRRGEGVSGVVRGSGRASGAERAVLGELAGTAPVNSPTNAGLGVGVAQRCLCQRSATRIASSVPNAVLRARRETDGRALSATSAGAPRGSTTQSGSFPRPFRPPSADLFIIFELVRNGLDSHFPSLPGAFEAPREPTPAVRVAAFCG